MTLDKMLVWKTKRTVWSSTDFRKRQTVKTWTFNGCRLPAQYESWLCDWDCKNKNKGKQRHEREDNTGVLRLSVAKGMSRCGRWTFEIEYEWIYEFIMTCSMYSIYWFLHCTMEFYYMNLTCLPFFRFMYVSILLLSLHRACVRSVAVSCIPMTPMCRQNGSAIASVILATPLETGFFCSSNQPLTNWHFHSECWTAWRHDYFCAIQEGSLQNWYHHGDDLSIRAFVIIALSLRFIQF